MEKWTAIFAAMIAKDEKLNEYLSNPDAAEDVLEIHDEAEEVVT